MPSIRMNALDVREQALLGTGLVLFLAALLGPALTGPLAGVSTFADDRAWHGLANAMDVLSNLPFLAIGLYGLHAIRRGGSQRRHCARVFFAGLVACAVGSTLYHLQPDWLRLAGDRAGMAVAFGGLVGFAVCERIAPRAGPTATWAMVLGGLAAVAVWHRTGNVTPWAVVQFGGMALVLALAVTRPLPTAAGLGLGWVIALYVLAKVFELADQPVYEATRHLVSGHSLKHLTAALAGLPVLHALVRRPGAAGRTLRHNPGAAELSV